MLEHPLPPSGYATGEDNGPVQAMQILTKKYGSKFWKKTIIVLTFANTIESFNLQWKKLKEEDKILEYHKTLLDYNLLIRKNLEECAKVEKEIVNQIQIIPASHYSEPKQLLDRSYWLSALWFQCLDTIPTLDAKASLVRYYQDRLVEEEDPFQNPENCNIALDSTFVPGDFLKFKRKWARIGAGFGTFGLFFVLITIPLGYWAGDKFGAREYITKNCRIQRQLPC